VDRRGDAADPDQRFAIPEPTDSGIRVPLGKTLAEIGRIVIQHTLHQHEGNTKLMANHLGISLKTLYNRLNEHAEDTANSFTGGAEETHFCIRRAALSLLGR
jgi:DNA-binding NtrC family response regulator